MSVSPRKIKWSSKDPCPELVQVFEPKEPWIRVSFAAPKEGEEKGAYCMQEVKVIGVFKVYKDYGDGYMTDYVFKAWLGDENEFCLIYETAPKMHGFLFEPEEFKEFRNFKEQQGFEFYNAMPNWIANPREYER